MLFDEQASKRAGRAIDDGNTTDVRGPAVTAGALVVSLERPIGAFCGYRCQQFIESRDVHRFREMNVETGFGCAAFVFPLPKAGRCHERKRPMAISVANLLGHLVPIESRHSNVQDSDFRPKVLDRRQRTRSVTGRRDGVPFAL